MMRVYSQAQRFQDEQAPFITVHTMLCSPEFCAREKITAKDLQNNATPVGPLTATMKNSVVQR